MKKQSGLFFIAVIVALGWAWLMASEFPQPSHHEVAFSLSVPTALSLLAPPPFNAGTRLQANGVDIKVDTYAAAACVTDWNGDGKKDLLVGCFYYGNVYLYLNSGTNSKPVFTTGSKLQANGTDISVAYG